MAGTPSADSDPPVADRSDRRRQRHKNRLRFLIAALIVVLVGAAGGAYFATRDGASEKAAPKRTTTTPTTTVVPAGPAVSATFASAPLRAATTKGGDLAVYSAPTPNTPPANTLSAQTEYLAPRTVLAFDQFQDWLHVYLPTRPNSSTAWVKMSDVNVSPPLADEVRVSLADHTLTLLHDGAVVFQVPAAVGTDDDPTPTGTFYFTDPVDLASNPGTAYGVFAMGLSGHSNVLSEFAGGDGQIAIHGTNDPSTIGSSVSHGCVRVNNDIILKLSKLPLGTPVVIT